MAEGPAAILSEQPVRRLRLDGLEARVPRFMAVTGKKAKERAMESFDVDIDPSQLVRWIMAEHKTAPSTFKTSARRAIEVRALPEERKYHLGDEEREDLTEVATVATLEISPAHERDGWLLTVTVEDEIGPRAAGEGAEIQAEQQIDLGTFYNEFIRSGRGVANVVAEAENPSARLHVRQLLDTIERNQHSGERQPSATR